MAAVPPDLVQDVAFGAAFVLAGIDIIATAIKKRLPAALSAFLAAASAYGALYL